MTMATGPRDLVVRFLADVNGFLRGTDQVEDALRDASRDQEALADQGEETARRLATAYDRAADKIKRDAQETKRDTRKAFADTGREAGQEFTANLGESISSGDLSSIAADTAGGLAATFGAAGPIGIAFAAVATAGSVAFASMQAAAEKARASAASAFDELKSGADKQARIAAVLEDQYGSQMEGWEQIARLSEATGVSSERIVDALVTGGSRARVYADEWDTIARKYYESTGNLDRQTSLLSDGADLLNRRADALDRAAKAAKVERDALAESESILKRSARYYSQRGSAYAPGGSTYQQQVPSLYRSEKR